MMVHRFRIATEMRRNTHNKFFLHRSDLVAKTKAGDTVVLIDDFAATGQQACGAWEGVFAELLSAGQKVILMLMVATEGALERIGDGTQMNPVCNTVLRPADDIFSSACRHFNTREKDKILKYCNQADSGNPKGFGQAGLLVVFSHGCPNNTIPILHAQSSRWRGLFPAHA